MSVNTNEFRNVQKFPRTNSAVNKATATFAPTFISTDGTEKGDEVLSSSFEGTDFSGKKWVWVKDPHVAFIKGYILDDKHEGETVSVLCDDGMERTVNMHNLDKVNPAKFDKASDMAELTHLNEASVVHNLHSRYLSDLIYTYSGLFLVTVNPYCLLPIYSDQYVEKYRNKSRDENQPHIFAVSDMAFRNLMGERMNQSILVTGESGAGKTENTKKVIQYLASVALDQSSSKTLGTLEQQILKANPILEAFGNAQTVRNNNSSRFGKFIRIEFTGAGQIAGAYIDWYLLEKSRVVKQSSGERNYHIFYQLLQGASKDVLEQIQLSNDITTYTYLRASNKSISGVDDAREFKILLDAFKIMGFKHEEQLAYFRIIAAVLHLGNLTFAADRSDSARIIDSNQVERVCSVLGIPMEAFTRGLLNPKVKAGREWIHQSRTMDQVKQSVDALSKGIYERGFGDLVTRLNAALERRAEEAGFIGVLDIAGFEIFESNSFEQLCINYTNEKLQQFFNHHMFVLEQEEYARERIEWKFIDFGHDLQPTINLIELPNPIGIFSCLDEDCVMPKATDKSFTDKLHALWDKRSQKYKRSMLSQGFVLTHYAADVEYSTEGWLDKNKDPLNDNITRLLARSENPHIASLFADCLDDADTMSTTRSLVKKGLFRTVAQRHKEQLSSLINQLQSTHPHFVRCIIPNHEKRPRVLKANLVLDQLRCNGVLEGIRIARTGFPNRLTFAEFRQRYEVLVPGTSRRHLDDQHCTKDILKTLELDSTQFRIGLSKAFFRAGVLADLEEQRDALVRTILVKFQSVVRGFLQRKMVNKVLFRSEAIQVIYQNLGIYRDLSCNPWWKLFLKTKPLLGATVTSSEVRKRDDMIVALESKLQEEYLDRTKVDEERRRTEFELAKVQQTLEAERALALDKEEIFKRLQQREQDLSEKLSGALEDQDILEDQIDQLLTAKRKVTDQAEQGRDELEQAVRLIQTLEAEKRTLLEKLSDIEEKTKNLQGRSELLTDRETNLLKEVSLLKSHLSLKERKLSEYEGLVVRKDQEMTEKLHESSKEVETLSKLNRELKEQMHDTQTRLNLLSTASNDYEIMLQRKESELHLTRADVKQLQSQRKGSETERQHLLEEHNLLHARLKQLESDLASARSQKVQAEREAGDSRRSLEAKISEDVKLGRGKNLLDNQISDLKGQLFAVKEELQMERKNQSNIRFQSETHIKTLQREQMTLRNTNSTLENELLTQQEALQAALTARSDADKERALLQTDLQSLKEHLANMHKARIEAENITDTKLSRQANELSLSLRKDLEQRETVLREVEQQRDRLAKEVRQMSDAMTASESSRKTSEQLRARLEQEIFTVRARLSSSENDNRTLQNKIQQKNLEVAKSTSKASEQYRSRIVALTQEKAKAEEILQDTKKHLNDTQMSLVSLEKQREKLSLDLEDANLELSRERKSSRGYEKSASLFQAQLNETTRSLEAEKQAKNQAHTNNRKLQTSLNAANQELDLCHQQLLLLQKVVDPSIDGPTTWNANDSKLKKSIDMAQVLEDVRQQLRVVEEGKLLLSEQLMELRKKYQHEMQELDTKHSNSRKILLDEVNENGKLYDSPKMNRPSAIKSSIASPKTPTKRAIYNSFESPSSTRTDKTVDTIVYQRNMDIASDLEMLQNQLQMAEMQNRHLQNLLNANSNSQKADDTSSLRHVLRLERENDLLQDKLDDEAGKTSALEAAMRSTELSMLDVNSRSHEELVDLISSQEKARMTLLSYHHAAISELQEAKIQVEKIRSNKSNVELQLRDLKSELDEMVTTREQEIKERSQILRDNANLQIRLNAELSKASDLASNSALYKARSEEYYSKLEQAEIAVLRATRAEAFAREQNKEAQDLSATILSERKQIENLVEDLQSQCQKHEEKIEDLAADLSDALSLKKRLQQEIEDYRNHREIDLEDKESLLEQARKKYQSEISQLSQVLEDERDVSMKTRLEYQRVRDELDDVRQKWEDEILNSNTSAKEKSRLEVKLVDLAKSHQEAVTAHNEIQVRVVSLLTQNRSLRTSVDELTNDREQAQNEKRLLEQRLLDAGKRLDDLSNNASPALRQVAGLDREVLDLKALLAQQEDIAATAIEKMRRSEALVTDTQKDMNQERERVACLEKEKVSLEKSLREIQHKVVDLETQSFSSGSRDVRQLHLRIQELEKSMENVENEKSKMERSTRNVDRTVRDLQSQIDRREKAIIQLEDDVHKNKDKIERLLQTIDELQTSDSSNQLAARRAEREVREEREKVLRLEKELEGWKALRIEHDLSSRSKVRQTTLDASSSSLNGIVMSRNGEPKTFL